jgi:hypothetical protein
LKKTLGIDLPAGLKSPSNLLVVKDKCAKGNSVRLLFTPDKTCRYEYYPAFQAQSFNSGFRLWDGF